MSGALSGKLAIITGAGSGIGRAACSLLVRDGAMIVAADRNVDAAIKTVQPLGEKNFALEVDVSSKDSIRRGLGEILRKYSVPPSIVVNAAGITKDNFLLKLSEEDFDEVIRINLKGTFLIMQTFADAMIERNITNGSLINLASIIGKTGNIGQVNYSASKAGVEAMTRTAAKEFGKFQIRVNSVLPGFIDTPMTDSVPQKVRDIMVRQCALRRFGKPVEVAEVIAFLASDKSSFINGASIEVTGGY